MNGTARTFFSGQDALRYLQQNFGSADYQNWQSLRRSFYSFVDYTATGASSFTFFGTPLGQAGNNRQLTNMPKGGSFGQQHFLLKAIRCKYFIADPQFDSWVGTDATTLYSDLINGVFQAGVFTLNIQNREFIQFPKPFLYAPPGDGQAEVFTAGIEALTLSEGTPNTLATYRSHSPWAALGSREEGLYVVDPNILIEAEQNFTVSIDFPSGALAPIATTIDSNSALHIGVSLDGVVLRPLQ